MRRNRRSAHTWVSITANIAQEWTKDVIYHSRDRQYRNLVESSTAATLFNCYRSRILGRANPRKEYSRSTKLACQAVFVIVFSTCGEWDRAIVRCCTKAPPSPVWLLPPLTAAQHKLHEGSVGMAPSIKGHNPASNMTCGGRWPTCMVAAAATSSTRGITARPEHRGAQGAEPHTGDAGTSCCRSPDEFPCRRRIDCPEYGATPPHCVPAAVLRRSDRSEAVEKTPKPKASRCSAGARSHRRVVASVLARDAMPTFRQLFLAGATA
jgi:hypothetical protein